MFGGTGACVTMCNATIAMILALRATADARPDRGRLVLMPSFTFAAAAHAVLWAGLRPLLVDVDPDDWGACAECEEALLREHGAEVVAVMPYATFGNCVDLDRYEDYARRHGVGVVVDAAASLGSVDGRGLNFGAGFPHPVVFSMHATKAFGAGEGALVHCGDGEVTALLRRMSNFGFDADRTASTAGLNAKMSEVAALAALVRLGEFEGYVDRRSDLAATYRDHLPAWTPQRLSGRRIAYQTVPMLLPAHLAHRRAEVQAGLSALGVGTGRYFSPHVAEHPHFRDRCTFGPLPVTEALSSRIVSLPLHDLMDEADVMEVCERVDRVCSGLHPTALAS